MNGYVTMKKKRCSVDYKQASKNQLLTIAFDETNSLEDRYSAVKELENRKHEE